MDMMIQEPCGNTVDFYEDYGDEDTVIGAALLMNAVDIDVLFDAISQPLALVTIDRQTCTVHEYGV